ncbi:transporter substrate-binding domain-containing protein [Candidatus Bipolaricaulota bacterium]|nr:transporter substrate-binding domain-containing protein [Candidatus Bipolaricaulota bacterium]
MKKALLVALLVGIFAFSVVAETYIVGSDIPWKPFEMITADGEFFGFDLDLMRAIAITAGFEIEIRNVAFDAIIEEVRAGRVDIGASGFTITAEREQTIDFSEPYFLSNQAVVIRKDSGLNIISALAGEGANKAVGAQNSTTGLWWGEDNLAGFGVTINGYETYPAAILDLVNGRIDAVIQDEPASKASIAAYPDLLTVAGVINTYEYFGFLVADGDPDGLLPRINAALATLGLTVVDAAGGLQELVIAEGSVIESLLQIYFEPDPANITAAWEACKGNILNGDLDGFITCMKAELGL